MCASREGVMLAARRTKGLGRPGEVGRPRPASSWRVVRSTIATMSAAGAVMFTCLCSGFGPSVAGLSNTCGTARIALLRGCKQWRTLRCARTGLVTGGTYVSRALTLLRTLRTSTFSLSSPRAGIDMRGRDIFISACWCVD